MNGIASLGPGQAPQQAPQGPQQPPQQVPQGGPQGTPQGMTAQLKDIPLPQLQMFMMNPGPQSPPLWAVISAIAEKQKEAKAMQMAQGDQVMAMNAQMQQQPPVAAQVMQSAQQMQEPVYAMHGGEMHGYSGGGAVAFQSAGVVPPGLLNPDFDEEGLPRGKDEREQIIDYNNKIRAAYEQQMKAKTASGPRTAAPSMQDIAGLMAGRRQLEQFYKPRDPEAYTPEKVGFRVGDVPPTAEPSVPMRMQDTRGGTPEMAALAQMLGSAPAPMAPPGGGQRRAATETRPQEPPKPGLPSLIGPQIDPYLLMAREGQQNIARALERSGKLTPEEIVARGGIDKLLSESASSFEEERKRREALAQQRMQEAQARFERPGYKDIAGIGRLLGGMRGAKTLYEGLTGAGAAAGKYQEDKEAALRAAQEKFDLSGKEMFDLRRLQNQVQIDQAKLVEARASGDAQRSVNAALKLGESQQKLAEFESGIADKAAGRRLEEKRIDVTQQESIADRASRERIAGAQLAQRAQEIGDLKLVNSLNAANQTVSSAFEKMGRDLEKEFGTIMKMSQMMSPEDIAKDPRLAASYKQYIQKREEYFNKIVQPALDNRDRLANRITMGTDLKQWGDVKVKQGG